MYGPAGHPPLLLRARVARDDGSAGCVLTFRDVPLDAAAELESWTELLPNLTGSEGGASSGSVVSERVDDDAEGPAGD